MEDRHKYLRAEYKVGDLFEVMAYDQGDEKWEWGRVLITEIHTNPVVPPGQWCYGCEALDGTIKWSAVGVAHIQEDTPSMYKKYIGNVYNDLAVRILYDRSQNTRRL